ncbi:cation diffusion facilitator family transporter [Kribbella sp. NPDC026596]|uniref:cation diffusion facilitator family transporter n=1 Tax=Kribbella sp. NPDC026596 TaxID=3155122 RepID=UPI0033CE992C
MAEESDGTVLLAGAANLAIAIAKVVAGLLSGSTALLAEAAHSVADTLNQAFLLTALRRSRKPADARHPFGYGMERYFWSLLAAVGILVLGAGFSIAEGVRAVFDPEPIAALAMIYSVLALSFLFEGTSWLRAITQVRREAREHGVPFLTHLKNAEPAVKTVAFEDSAALIGL